jgi:hypothetical protein
MKSKNRKKAEKRPVKVPAFLVKIWEYIKKRPVFAVISGLLLVCVVIGLIFAYRANSRKGTVYYYVAGNELFRANGTNSGTQLSSNFLTGDITSDRGRAEAAAAVLAEMVKESGDGIYVYFPDNNDGYSQNVTLYCRKISGGPIVRVDSDISAYATGAGNSYILYEKNGALYRFSPKTGVESIAPDFKSYVYSPNLKDIAFVGSDGSLWVKTGDAAAECVDRDVTSVGMAGSGGSVLYVKNEVLYTRSNKTEKTKICSDVLGDGFLGDLNCPSEGRFFLTYEKYTENTSLYVEDTFAEADGLIPAERPEAPSYPNKAQYSSEGDYEAAMEQYQIDYSAYLDAEKAYADKAARDALRQALASSMTVRTVPVLNYCSGDKVSVLAMGIYVSGGGESDSPEGGSSGFFAPVVSYSNCAYFKAQETAVAKPRLEDYDNVSDITAAVAKAVEPTSYSFELVLGGERVYGTADSCAAVFFLGSEKTAYYFADGQTQKDGSLAYTLHKATSAKTSKDETVDTGVYLDGFAADGCLYYKEVKTERGRGTLYRNGKKIAEDVTVGSARAGGNNTYYLSDFVEKQSGTLSVHGGRKSSKIADDVHAFAVTKAGKVVYIGNYAASGDNELYFGNKGKEITVNASVVFVK